MLLIRELGRLVDDIVGFTVLAIRPWVLVVIVAAAVAVITATSVTIIGPLSIYPLL